MGLLDSKIFHPFSRTLHFLKAVNLLFLFTWLNIPLDQELLN